MNTKIGNFENSESKLTEYLDLNNIKKLWDLFQRDNLKNLLREYKFLKANKYDDTKTSTQFSLKIVFDMIEDLAWHEFMSAEKLTIKSFNTSIDTYVKLMHARYIYQIMFKNKILFSKSTFLEQTDKTHTSKNHLILKNVHRAHSLIRFDLKQWKDKKVKHANLSIISLIWLNEESATSFTNKDAEVLFMNQEIAMQDLLAFASKKKKFDDQENDDDIWVDHMNEVEKIVTNTTIMRLKSETSRRVDMTSDVRQQLLKTLESRVNVLRWEIIYSNDTQRDVLWKLLQKKKRSDEKKKKSDKNNDNEDSQQHDLKSKDKEIDLVFEIENTLKISISNVFYLKAVEMLRIDSLNLVILVDTKDALQLKTWQIRDIARVLIVEVSSLRDEIIADSSDLSKTIQDLCIILLVSELNNMSDSYKSTLILVSVSLINVWIAEIELRFSNTLIFRIFHLTKKKTQDFRRRDLTLNSFEFERYLDKLDANDSDTARIAVVSTFHT